MTVAELIKILKKQPQDLPVCYMCCSEQMLLKPDDVVIEDLCEPRPDGWVANKRPDKPTQKYLVLPGN